jgi:presenilin-like A22 family membrane protease
MYDVVSVTYILLTFSEGTLSDPEDTAVFFSAHMLSKSRVIVAMAAPIIEVLPDWFQWWHVKSAVECHNKMCSKLLCLGQFHVTKVGTCDF